MRKPTSYSPPDEPATLSTSEIQTLIDERRLLRILRPDLKENIEHAVAAGDYDNSQLAGQILEHVIEHNGEIYLTFENIIDRNQREQAYYLVQQLQMGGMIDTALLPASLRSILEPGSARRNRRSITFAFCVLAGIASGVTAMAISVLITTIMNTPYGHFAGMDITAIVFLVFCVLGWLSSAVIAWAKARKPVVRNNG